MFQILCFQCWSNIFFAQWWLKWLLTQATFRSMGIIGAAWYLVWTVLRAILEFWECQPKLPWEAWLCRGLFWHPVRSVCLAFLHLPWGAKLRYYIYSGRFIIRFGFPPCSLWFMLLGELPTLGFLSYLNRRIDYNSVRYFSYFQIWVLYASTDLRLQGAGFHCNSPSVTLKFWKSVLSRQ